MKNIIKVILLFLSLSSFGQENYQDKLILPFEKYVDSLETDYRFSIYQIIGEDSIVLTDKWEYFGAIQVFNNNIKILELSEEKNKDFSYEIDIFKNSICKIFNDYYIFKIDNRPSLNSYFILQKTKTGFEILGETEENTAFIFGDVDNDSYFEIGGFKYRFEGNIDIYGDRDSVYDARFRIFELNEKGIKREVELEKEFKQTILERIDIPFSGGYQGYILQEPILDKPITISSIRKYPALSIYKIWNNSLDGISKKELRIMRNEIFASYGYNFKSKDLQEYFSKQSWYVPSDDNVVDKLTEIEKYNIQLIKKKENE